MKTSQQVHQRFEAIRRTFFPAWDRKGQWHVRCDRRWPGHGHCDIDHRRIIISWAWEDRDRLDELLIHEICHAVASPGHARRWQRRMEKAAARAVQLGRTQVSKLIREDAAGYRGKPLVRATDVYRSIADAVVDSPTGTYRAILKWVAADVGYLPSQLETKYRRCREAFVKATREQRQIAAARKLHSRSGLTKN